jgi:hypothetical protein
LARIRSIHPALFTDEAFVGLSCDAQMLLLGLWTEADDQGVFEWKPVTLRMRLRPTKDGPIEPLLSELGAANCIMRYEIGGRQYGAIRNFRRFQKPKSPNAVHPITPEIGIYTALSKPTSGMQSAEAPPLPHNGEIASLMEEGGDDEGEEGGDTRTRDPFEDFWSVFPNQVGKMDAEQAFRRAEKLVAPEILIETGRRYAQTVRRDGTEPRFVKTPAKWLDGKRWTDGGGGKPRVVTAFNSPEEIEAQRLAQERLNGKAAV